MLKMYLNEVDALLDAEIQQIVTLKRMAANPRLLDLMRQIVAASEGKSANSAIRDQQTLPGITTQGEPPSPPSYQPNGLTPATWKAVVDMKRPFTIPDIVDALDKSGFQFVAAKPKVAVAAPLKVFLKQGKIRLVKQGFGSEPNTYELAVSETTENTSS